MKRILIALHDTIRLRCFNLLRLVSHLSLRHDARGHYFQLTTLILFPVSGAIMN